MKKKILLSCLFIFDSSFSEENNRVYYGAGNGGYANFLSSGLVSWATADGEGTVDLTKEVNFGTAAAGGVTVGKSNQTIGINGSTITTAGTTLIHQAVTDSSSNEIVYIELGNYLNRGYVDFFSTEGFVFWIDQGSHLDIQKNLISLSSNGVGSCIIRNTGSAILNTSETGGGASSSIADGNRENIFDCVKNGQLTLPYTTAVSSSNNISYLKSNIRYVINKITEGTCNFSGLVQGEQMTLYGTGSFTLNGTVKNYVNEDKFTILNDDKIIFTEPSTQVSFKNTISLNWTSPASYDISIPGDHVQSCIVLAAKAHTIVNTFENSIIMSGEKIVLSGNTNLDGTLNTTGNFSVHTNQFTVDGANGNTTLGGTITAASLGTGTGTPLVLDGSNQIVATTDTYALSSSIPNLTTATNFGKAAVSQVTVGNGDINILIGGSYLYPSNGITLQGYKIYIYSENMVINTDGNFTVTGKIKAPLLEVTGNTTVGGTITASNLGTGLGTSLVLNGSNQIVAQSSSCRYKENIQTIEDISEHNLDALEVVEFNYKQQENKKCVGLIAEDLVGTPFEFAVFYNAEGLPESIDYQSIFVYLLGCYKKTTHEFKEILKNLTDEIQVLKAIISN